MLQPVSLTDRGAWTVQTFLRNAAHFLNFAVGESGQPYHQAILMQKRPPADRYTVCVVIIQETNLAIGGCDLSVNASLPFHAPNRHCVAQELLGPDLVTTADFVECYGLANHSLKKGFGAYQRLCRRPAGQQNTGDQSPDKRLTSCHGTTEPPA